MNVTIINQFKLLLKQVQLDIEFGNPKKKLENGFRYSSLKKALDAIKAFPERITSGEQIAKLDGIGKGTIKRVNEILSTGILSEIKLDDRIVTLDIMDELENVFGIGRKRAYDLVKDHNITSVEDLERLHTDGMIELPSAIVKGLKYWRRTTTSIPRNDVDIVSGYLDKVLLSIDNELHGCICGSYRRLKDIMGDVDCIIVHPSIRTKEDADSSNYLERVVQVLIKKRFIVDSFTGTDVSTKYMGLFMLGSKQLARIDIRFMPYDSYYSAILYFTGSRDFNRMMRGVALNMGYTLNEYGLYDETGNRFAVNTEQDIFDILNLEYVSPEKR